MKAPRSLDRFGGGGAGRLFVVLLESERGRMRPPRLSTECGSAVEPAALRLPSRHGHARTPRPAGTHPRDLAHPCPNVTRMDALTCPYGHPLTPGEILVGWSPCICPPAWAHHGGHRTIQCLTCNRRHIETVLYDPERVGGGHPNRRSLPDQPSRGGSQ